MLDKLFTEFNSTTATQWKDQLIKDLKGIDFETLVWKTNSELDVQPFYTNENVLPTSNLAFTHHDWAICEYINVDDALQGNADALNALSNGASGLVFNIQKKIDITALLKNILLEHIYCLFKINSDLLDELKTTLKSIDTGSNCYIECDVVSQLIQTGNWNTTYEKDFDSLKTNTSIVVDGCIYQESGANTVNELAFTISHVNDYINYYTEKSLQTKLKNIHISVSIGGDFFMEIAKLRALRKLTHFLLEQYQLKLDLHIHGQTTSINKSKMDSYTNMLRSTTESMSASIGGCNSIVTLPFDNGFAKPTDFSKRMARNQQLILKEESYLNKVADMAAGSYYIENTTIALCEKAWQQFKTIESNGGLIESLKLNTIQKLVTKDAEILINQAKEGKLVLVGVNKFQNKDEKKIIFEKEILSKIKATNIIAPIKAIRLSEAFEN